MFGDGATVALDRVIVVILAATKRLCTVPRKQVMEGEWWRRKGTPVNPILGKRVDDVGLQVMPIISKSKQVLLD
jgi:hypothetical protein